MASSNNTGSHAAHECPIIGGEQIHGAVDDTSDIGGSIMGRKMSIGVMFILVTQIFMGGWWAASASGELKALREKIEESSTDRYTKTEARLQNASTDRRLSALENVTITQSVRLRDIELTVREIAAYNRKR